MRFTPSRVTTFSLAIGALIGFATCQINLGDDSKYKCADDRDCGGDGFRCAIVGGKGTCCRPTGPEVCDGQDNDCDGVVDNTGKPEVCNGVDDDCNGKVDEGYDLKSDPANCGMCGHACDDATELCIGGACVRRVELDCFDGQDNDNNGLTDCADPACDHRSCGAACLCVSLVKTETVCSDALDNDGDGIADCKDPDCTGESCAHGCTCATDGGSFETDCTDGVDNDGDGLKDCLDPDCLNKFCTPPALYFACSADKTCKCNNSVQVAEVGSVLCNDGIDNDCNGKVDCAETSCDGQRCTADGGTACTCAGGAKKETDCTNLTDDDGDGAIDCADSDCPASTPCTKAAGGAGTCSATKTCE